MTSNGNFKMILNFSLFILLLFMTISNVRASTDISAMTPNINYFKPSNYHTSIGKIVTFYWKVTNADKIEISGIENSSEIIFPLEGSLEVWPTETTTYVLKAYDGNGNAVTSQFTIYVSTLEVEYFKASSEDITPGETVRISWCVPNASTVEIKEATNKDLPFDGVIEVTPYISTTYTLEATGFDNSYIKKELTVRVAGPNIVNFSSDKEEVSVGDSVYLSWDVLYAKNIRINNIAENLPPKGTLEVKPNAEKSVYTLEVTSYDGSIIVKDIWIWLNREVIHKFIADKDEINSGESVTLSWNVTNAKSLKIIGVDSEELPFSGSLVLSPCETTSYILEVTDFNGKVYSAKITVRVNVARIISFTASKNVISKGELITLSWETNDMVKCFIVTNFGQKLPNRPTKGLVSVTPNKDIVYTLYAIDKNGNEHKSDVNIHIQNND